MDDQIGQIHRGYGEALLFKQLMDRKPDEELS